MNDLTKQFIDWYYKEDEYFYIYLLDNHNQRFNNTYLHNKKSFLEKFENLKYHNEKRSIYFTFNNFKKLSTSRKKENVETIKSIVFDFDNVKTSKNDLMNLVKYFKNYNYILQTSENKYQILYRLNPHSIEFKEFELIHKTLSKYFKSDENVCSIEKVFRLPYSKNLKNGYTTSYLNDSNGKMIFRSDLTTDIQIFIDFINQNEEVKKIYEEIIENKKKILKSKKVAMIDTTKTTIFKEEDFEIEEKLIKKYRSIFMRNQSDASKTDILYIKERMKIINDFEIIFNEIIKIRNKLSIPLKRNIDDYYRERYENIYLKNIK
jgi:hypothetical protein